MINTTHSRRRLTLAAVILLPVLAGVACRDLTSLQQSNPGTLSAASTYVPINAQLLLNGAIGDVSPTAEEPEEEEVPFEDVPDEGPSESTKLS